MFYRPQNNTSKPLAANLSHFRELTDQKQAKRDLPPFGAPWGLPWVGHRKYDFFKRAFNACKMPKFN